MLTVEVPALKNCQCTEKTYFSDFRDDDTPGGMSREAGMEAFVAFCAETDPCARARNASATALRHNRIVAIETTTL
jgi:hypothetical protein